MNLRVTSIAAALLLGAGVAEADTVTVVPVGGSLVLSQSWASGKWPDSHHGWRGQGLTRVAAYRSAI